MKKLSRILMMMLVLSVGTGITSCDEIEDMIDNPVVPEPTPTPTPQPEPTPQPTPEEIENQRIADVQALMDESRQEGSITEVYYTEDGVEKVANFKRVGNKYVLQTPSATRGDNDESLVPGLMDDDSDEDLEDDDDDDDGEIVEEFINEDEDDDLDVDDDDDDCDVIPMPFDEDVIEEADDEDDESAAGSRMMTRGKTNVKNGLLYFTDISTGMDGYQISLYHNSGTFSVVMDDEVKITSISFGGKVAVNGKAFYVKPKAETIASKKEKIKIRKVFFMSKKFDVPQSVKRNLQVQIAPTNAKVKKITWKSKKTKIAKVQKTGWDNTSYLAKCMLTSKKKSGKVTIACNAKGYKNSKKCSCRVFVTNTYLYPVSGVKVYPSSLSLLVGEKATLSYTISPVRASKKDVVWNTSDRTIVSVDDGTIEAHNVGTATITVTTIDGGYTAVCIVTVKAAPEPDPEPEPEPEEDPNSTIAKPDNFNSGDSPF